MIRKTIEERFWEKVEITPTCWLWRGAKTNGTYGKFYIDGKLKLVHRLAYEWFIGLIPEGYEIDHLCRVRDCFIPSHLESVTPKENIRRGKSANKAKTHCSKGHEYSEENTRFEQGKVGIRRQCRACHREYSRKRHMRAIILKAVNNNEAA